MIRLERVTKIYPGEFVALENVDLLIKKGEYVSVVGSSGAGKSTLFKLITGEEQPTKGRVYFNDRPIDEIPKQHLPYYRRNIGTVFQDFKLLPQKTVFENVSFALEVAGETNDKIREEVPKILDIVGLSNKMEKYPGSLSGGERQKVSLARALIHRPQIILADEPTGNLDPVSTWEIVQLLLKINSFGTTILMATHNKPVVDQIGKRVILIDHGRLMQDVERGKYVMQ